jgi:hypothetical protein
MLCLLNVSEPTFCGNPKTVQPWYTYDSRFNGLLSPDITSLYVDYILLRRDHAAPPEWNNYVIQASSYPANWSGTRARGYELSDHFPVAGFARSADAPSPVTTRVARDREEHPGVSSSVVYYAPCPPASVRRSACATGGPVDGLGDGVCSNKLTVLCFRLKRMPIAAIYRAGSGGTSLDKSVKTM